MKIFCVTIDWDNYCNYFVGYTYCYLLLYSVLLLPQNGAASRLLCHSQFQPQIIVSWSESSDSEQIYCNRFSSICPTLENQHVTRRGRGMSGRLNGDIAVGGWSDMVAITSDCVQDGPKGASRCWSSNRLTDRTTDWPTDDREADRPID